MVKLKNIVVKNSKIKGKGVFANRNFKRGEVINKWHPLKIVSEKDIKKLSESEKNKLTYIGKGKFILMGIPERYVNHSCNPNTYIKDKKDIAIRNIKKGEEITSDYSIGGAQEWKMKCGCKSKNCRKIICGDFFKLPKELQKKYFNYLENWFKKEFNIK